MRINKRFFAKYLKILPLRLLILLALFMGAVLLFVYIAHEVLWEQEAEVDQAVFDFLSANVISPKLTGFMEVVTWFASPALLQIAYGLLVLIYLFQKKYRRCIEVAVIGIGGFLVNYGMKIIFQRARPSDALISQLQSFSFPSGHAASAFIFYGLLAYLIWNSKLAKPANKVMAVLLSLFALLIGFSRVYLRVHYTSDVVAGFCIGLAWLTLSIWLMERTLKNADAKL